VSSVYARTLQKAAELIGGRQKLARHLRVPAAELEKWLSDGATPPISTFLKAVDLVIDETPAPSPAVASDNPAEPGERQCSGGGDQDGRDYRE
jgi:hypothetical protein